MHGILHQIRCSKYQRHEKHGATLLTFDGKCFEEQAARDIDSKDSKLCPARTTDVLVISPSGRRWSLPCLQRDDAMQGLVLNSEKLGPFAFSPHFWPFVHPFFAFLGLFWVSSRDSRMTLTLFIHVHHIKLWPMRTKELPKHHIYKGRGNDHRGITSKIQ